VFFFFTVSPDSMLGGVAVSVQSPDDCL